MILPIDARRLLAALAFACAASVIGPKAHADQTVASSQYLLAPMLTRSQVMHLTQRYIITHRTLQLTCTVGMHLVSSAEHHQVPPSEHGSWQAITCTGAMSSQQISPWHLMRSDDGIVERDGAVDYSGAAILFFNREVYGIPPAQLTVGTTWSAPIDSGTTQTTFGPPGTLVLKVAAIDPSCTCVTLDGIFSGQGDLIAPPRPPYLPNGDHWQESARDHIVVTFTKGGLVRDLRLEGSNHHVDADGSAPTDNSYGYTVTLDNVTTP